MATAFTDFRPAPKFIHPDTMPDLYAVPGDGSCMEPLIPDGSILAFDKRVEPIPGDTVVVWFTPEHARRIGAAGWVKRLASPILSGFSDWVAFDMLNPTRTFHVATRDFLAVHKCVGFAEVGEDGRTRFRLNQEAPR